MLSSAQIMSFGRTLICILVVAVSCGQLSRTQQLTGQSGAVTQVQTSATVSATSKTPPVSSTAAVNKNFEEYKKSPLFVEPFDPNILSLPEQHLAFVRNVTKNDIAFYKVILNEAITIRNKMAASVRLMLKYSARLMGNFIKNRRDERRLPERVEPKSEFFSMLADICTEVADLSGQLKKNYSKSTINIDEFRSRVETLFDTVERTIGISPMGAYMKWSQFVLYKDQARNGVQNRRFSEEAADLVAQFRAMGFESTSFMIRRIANLLRMFARGVMPNSEKDV